MVRRLGESAHRLTNPWAEHSGQQEELGVNDARGREGRNKRSEGMDNPDDDGPAHAYVLGHSDRELDCLSTQARLIDPITRQTAS
jgi:hypothetical protein